MEEDRHVRAKRAEVGAGGGGWSPGVGPLLGGVLGVLLILAAIILGVTTGIGLLFAVPLGILGLILALVVFRGKTRKVSVACPHCGARVAVPSHISEFDCTSCGKRIETRPSGG